MNRQVVASVLTIGILIGAAALFAVTQVFSDDDSDSKEATNEPVATATADEPSSTSGEVQVTRIA